MHTTTKQKTNIVPPKFAKKLKPKAKPKPKEPAKPKVEPKVEVKSNPKPIKPAVAPKSTANNKRPEPQKSAPEIVDASSVERVGVDTLQKFNSLFGFDIKCGKKK